MSITLVTGTFVLGTALGAGIALWILHATRPTANLLHNLTDGTMIVDVHGNIVSLNAPAETLLDTTTEQVRGMAYCDFVSGIVPEDQLAASSTGERFEFTVNGRVLEANSSDIKNPYGKTIGQVVTFRDMTQRSEVATTLGTRLEELTMLRKVYDELTGTLNIRSVMTFALDSAVRLSVADGGYIGLEEDGKIRIAEYIGDFDKPILDMLLERGEGIVGRTVRTRQSIRVLDVSDDPDYVDLNELTQAVMAFPLVTRNGKLVGVMVLVTSEPHRFSNDVFEFMQLLSNRISAAVDNANLHRQVQDQLEELKTSHDQIKDLEQLKTDMIRIAAHDLNGPLGSIKLNTDVLKRRIDEGEYDVVAELIERVQRAAATMERITHDILSLERIEQLARDPKDLNALNVRMQVMNVILNLGDVARVKSIDLKTELDAAEELMVSGEPTQIHEAMSNLVQNAIKYTPSGGEVCIRLKSESDRVLFLVEDNGYGIPEESQARLFQPFYRVKTAETASIVGTGLGLHIVKNIVERHRGEIIFESVAGQGSTFGFWLPCAS